MPEENVEVVRRSVNELNAFMRGELSSEAFAELFDTQFELHWHGEQTYPDTPQHLRGLAELLAFTKQYRDGWVDLVGEPLELVEVSGGRVFGLIRQNGRGRGSGVPIVIHFFGVWTIRDGKIHQIEYFRHRSDALEAAGLEE
jgi:ketosteroid isomerase-like protein